MTTCPRPASSRSRATLGNNLAPINVGRRVTPPRERASERARRFMQFARLIRLNRDVTSPSFRFDSRADVSFNSAADERGGIPGGRSVGRMVGQPAGRPPFDDVARYVSYDRVTGVTGPGRSECISRSHARAIRLAHTNERTNLLATPRVCSLCRPGGIE